MISISTPEDHFEGIFYNLHQYFKKSQIKKIVSTGSSSNYEGRGKSDVVIDYTITDRADVLHYWASYSEENSSISIFFFWI